MKSKRVLAYLLALAMSSTAVIAVSAEGEDTTTAPATPTTAAEDTTTAPADTTTAPAEDTTTAEEVTTTAAQNNERPEITTVEGVVYSVYINHGYATVAKVTAEKETVYILDSISGIPVVAVEHDAFSDASKLKSITVSAKNEYLRSVDGCLYDYYITYDAKDTKKETPIYHDVLLAVPAAKASFQLSPGAYGIGFSTAFVEDVTYSNASVFPNNKVVGNIAKDHGTFIVVSGKLHLFTTKTVTTANKDGTFTSADEVVVGDKYNDYITWAVSGGGTGDKTGDKTGNNADAPKTGSAGVGVALATLLAAGSTAVVLRKRGKRS